MAIRACHCLRGCCCDKAPSNHWLITLASSTSHIWPIKQTAALRSIKAASPPQLRRHWRGEKGREGTYCASFFLGLICALLQIQLGKVEEKGNAGDVCDMTPSKLIIRNKMKDYRVIAEAAEDRCVINRHQKQHRRGCEFDCVCGLSGEARKTKLCRGLLMILTYSKLCFCGQRGSGLHLAVV